MKRILAICMLMTLFMITCTVSTNNLTSTTEEYSWDRALRAHNRPDYKDDVQPRDIQDEPPGQYCLCSKIYDPVCASNNESYFNLCYLECKVPKAENVSVVHQGNCIPF